MTALRISPLDTAALSGMAHFLAAAGLPVADLEEPGRAFYRFDGDALVGFGGIEGEGPDRLLRSLVVLPDRRGIGVGRTMLDGLEGVAHASGAQRLHLLTTTAAPFFRKRGYADAARDAAPAAIAASAEFSRLCPASAAYLVKRLST